MLNPADCWDWQHLRHEAQRETRRLLNAAAADDAAQEALMRAFRHRYRCSQPSRPIPWVRAIARREALRLLQPDRRLEDHELPEIGTDETVAVPEFIELREAVRDLRSCDREIVWLRYWSGLTEVEIARRLAMPLGTVKTRLHRARSALRDALAAGA